MVQKGRKNLISEELPKDTVLYRYISPHEFLSMMMLHKEHYLRPSLWEDTYEGYLLRKMNGGKERRMVVKKLMKENTVEQVFEAAFKYQRLWFSRQFECAKCWTTVEESDAFWRIYGYDNYALRISTTVKEIEASLQGKGYTVPHIRKVVYDMESNEALDEIQISQILESDNAAEPYFHKRPAFEHEKEVRVTVANAELFQVVEYMNGFRLAWSFKNGTSTENVANAKKQVFCDLKEFVEKIKGTKEADHLYVEIPEINRYIQSVLVHPKAASWYVETIEELCKKNGILKEEASGSGKGFLGKSNLYEPVGKE